MLVEDHAYIRGLLRDFLQAACPGILIVEAADAASALAAFAEHRPALVLADIGLPDISGIELTLRIKQRAPEVPVIIVSQHAHPAFIEAAHAAGASGYVTKDRIHCDLLPAISAVSKPGKDRP